MCRTLPANYQLCVVLLALYQVQALCTTGYLDCGDVKKSKLPGFSAISIKSLICFDLIGFSVCLDNKPETAWRAGTAGCSLTAVHGQVRLRRVCDAIFPFLTALLPCCGASSSAPVPGACVEVGGNRQ